MKILILAVSQNWCKSQLFSEITEWVGNYTKLLEFLLNFTKSHVLRFILTHTQAAFFKSLEQKIPILKSQNDGMFCVLVQLRSVVVAGGSSMRRCATWCCIFTRTSGVSSAMRRSARRQMPSVCTTLWQLEPRTTSRSSMCFGSRQPTGPSLSSRPGRFIYQSSW